MKIPLKMFIQQVADWTIRGSRIPRTPHRDPLSRKLDLLELNSYFNSNFNDNDNNNNNNNTIIKQASWIMFGVN